MAAQEAATQPTPGHSKKSSSDTSASSVLTSPHLTPDSDSDADNSDGDHDLAIDNEELAPSLDGRDVYEMQQLNGQKSQYKDDEDDGTAGRRRPSDSTLASFQLYTPDEERAVVRKFDMKLVLFLSSCYLLSFLDRSNIGNARIAGMEEDLQTRPPNDSWYEWSLTSFYISYITFEWMSLLWKIIPAHIYVSIIVLSWGVTASLQSVATSYPMLVFLRALLGIGEAGFTGVPFYLSFFFKRNELAFRTAMFIAAAPLATTFAASLAWLILKVGEAGPIAPWRLLFLLEGFPSVIIAVIAWSVIPDSPQSASYLTPREKKVAKLRLREERPRHREAGSAADSRSGLRTRDVLSVFADPKAWITAVMFFLTNMAYSSLPVFLPTILQEMGHSALQSQALSAPPYLIAFVAVLVTAHLSDRMQRRTPFIVAHATASAAGYLVMALARPLGISPMIRYLAVYPAAIGFFNVVVLVISWSINNQPTESHQGGGFALLQVIGQCGPIVGTRLYPNRDAPYFEPGMWTCAGAMLGVVIMALTLRLLLARKNRELDATESGDEAGEAEGLVGSSGSYQHEKRGLHGRFRYML